MRDDDAAPEPSHEEIVERAARELAELERPPSMLKRVSARVREGASHHIRLAFEEVKESREAWSLLSARVRTGRKLEPAESAAVRQQLIDVMKTLPAGVLTAATGAIPFPGAMLLAPWMLQRLGLLPSRWREEAVLGRLREQAEHLREEGDHIAAERMECLVTEFESRSEDRHEMAEQTTMLTHWDLDGSGEIEGMSATRTTPRWGGWPTRLQSASMIAASICSFTVTSSGRCGSTRRKRPTRSCRCSSAWTARRRG